MAVPAHERPPEGLSPEWLAVWRDALRVMKRDGVWSPAMRPLLALYLRALVEAEGARLKGYAGAWDRAARRASMLADQCCLTPRARKAAGVRAREDRGAADDPFAAMDALRERRAARSKRRAKGGA